MKTRTLNDINLITGLVTLGYQPQERIVVEKHPQNQVDFIFESDEEFERLIEDFYNGRMSVDAQKYSSNFKSLKSSIYHLLNRRK